MPKGPLGVLWNNRDRLIERTRTKAGEVAGELSRMVNDLQGNPYVPSETTSAVKTSVLIVESAVSTCSACGMPADPTNSRHIFAIDEVGRFSASDCGAVFVGISSSEGKAWLELQVPVRDKTIPWVDYGSWLRR